MINTQQDQGRIPESRYRRLFESSRDGILILDAETREIIDANPRMTELIGLGHNELLGRELRQAGILPDEAAAETVFEELRATGCVRQDDLVIENKIGEALEAELVCNAYQENERWLIQCNFRDVTERKRFERKLLHDALHDGLTGLANRVFFTEHLQKTIERARRSPEEPFAVLFLDLDRFKAVNDTFGHAEGDNLLVQIARRIESILRSGDLVARMCGDEFTILVDPLRERSDASLIAEDIRKHLEKPFELAGTPVSVSASIGIAYGTDGYETAGAMLRDADMAMYRAKAEGKARDRVAGRRPADSDSPGSEKARSLRREKQ